MPDDEITNEETLNVYISYQRLTARSFADFSQAIAQLGQSVRSIHGELSRTDLVLIPELELASVHTGESIIFRFSEGWTPSVSMSRKGDIVIDVPKKIGIPLLIGYLLLTAAQKVESLYNTHLDNQVKAVELQLKRTELNKTVMESNSARHKLTEDASRVLNIAIQNNDFRTVKVNGATIVNRSEGGDDMNREDRQ
jgi:hypothetical protein